MYDWGDRKDLQRHIKRFDQSRKAYFSVAWTVAAEAGEILGAHVERAKQDTALLWEERSAGRSS